MVAIIHSKAAQGFTGRVPALRDGKTLQRASIKRADLTRSKGDLARFSTDTETSPPHFSAMKRPKIRDPARTETAG